MIRVDGKEIEGKFSFSVEVDRTRHPNVATISGIIQTKNHLEDIHTIANDRYVLRDVDIISESYGSEDENVVYGFTAGDYQVYWQDEEDNEDGET